MASENAAVPTRRPLTAIGAALCAFLLASFFVTVSPASAQGPPRTSQGTGIITSVLETSSRDAGPNRIAERVIEGQLLTGPLSGTFVEVVRGVVHSNGTVTFHGTITFSGSLEGCGEGTLVGRLAGRGTAGPAPVTDGTVALEVRRSTIAATGQGRVHQNGPLLSYDITYVCR